MPEDIWTTGFQVTNPDAATVRPPQTQEQLVMAYQRVKMLREQGVKAISVPLVDALVSLLDSLLTYE